MSGATTDQALAGDIVRAWPTIAPLPSAPRDVALPRGTWFGRIKAMLRLVGKDRVFFDLLERMAEQTVVSGTQLQRLSRDSLDVETADPLRQTKYESGRLVRTVLAQLRGAFLTPFDPQDIHTLVSELDAIVGTVAALARRIPRSHVGAMEPLFDEQADVLVAATMAVRDVVLQLRHGRTLSELRGKLIEIHHHESTGDDNHHAALSRLFDGTREPLEVLKWKELYEYIEAAIDGCEDVSNTLTRLVLKGG